MQSGYTLRGADLLVIGEVPIGSGLSSSAALLVATALALLANSGHEVERVHLAKLCQQAENDFVGMRCGIMDQFISCCAEEDRALILDCRSLSYRLLPIQAEIRMVICNTMVKHELSGGEYNKRRSECEEAVHRLQKAIPGIRALRDVSPKDLETYRWLLPDVIYKRAFHVVTENQRVLEAAEALERKDSKTFGKLMVDSHQSLKQNYEVSCRELDILVELAREVDGVLGSRMTGGGFGGCTITLLEASHFNEFQETIVNRYYRATGLRPEIYDCTAASAAEELNPSQ
jgi:galactokinase